MTAYSFLSVVASIVGPGGSFNLGSGAGAAEEGISIEAANDQNTMTIGADGTVMHSLRGDRSGTATVHLLKTSPVNAQLMAMYDAQRLVPALWGGNVIVVRQIDSGDVTTCTSVAFKRRAPTNYQTAGGTVEWAFDVGKIDGILGTY